MKISWYTVWGIITRSCFMVYCENKLNQTSVKFILLYFHTGNTLISKFVLLINSNNTNEYILLKGHKKDPSPNLSIRFRRHWGCHQWLNLVQSKENSFVWVDILSWSVRNREVINFFLTVEVRLKWAQWLAIFWGI